MNTDKKICDSLRDCNYFSRCGQIDSFDFEVEYVNSDDLLMLIAHSINWENLCLEISGGFSEFLSKNYRKEFRNWNVFVREAKQTVMKEIEEKVSNNWMFDNSRAAVTNHVCFHTLTILLLEYYSEFYTCEFYNNLLTVYLSGHFPCGWKGKYPEGKLLVY